MQLQVIFEFKASLVFKKSLKTWKNWTIAAWLWSKECMTVFWMSICLQDSNKHWHLVGGWTNPLNKICSSKLKNFPQTIVLKKMSCHHLNTVDASEIPRPNLGCFWRNPGNKKNLPTKRSPKKNDQLSPVWNTQKPSNLAPAAKAKIWFPKQIPKIGQLGRCFLKKKRLNLGKFGGFWGLFSGFWGDLRWGWI